MPLCSVRENTTNVASGPGLAKGVSCNSNYVLFEFELELNELFVIFFFQLNVAQRFSIKL